MKRVLAVLVVMVVIGLAIIIPASEQSLMMLRSAREWHRVRAEGDRVVAEYVFKMHGKAWIVTDHAGGFRRWTPIE